MTRSSILLKTVLSQAVLLTALTAWAASPEALVIRAGKLIDPASGTTASKQTIVIQNGRIAAIGANLPAPANATVIDLPHATVLPGLIDAHTHLCATVDERWDLGDFWIMALQRRAGYRAILGAAHAREMLEAGFTAVRDLGNAGDYLDMDLEKSIRFGIVPGPTVVASGRIIAPYGGQFWDKPADRKLLENPEYLFADSRDELRKGIRENIYMGANVIKIAVDSNRYAYSADDIRFIVEEAGNAGVKVAAHVQTARGVHNAIEGGVASIEHAWKLSDDEIAKAKQKGIVLVPTDSTNSVLRAYGMDEEGAKATRARQLDRLRRAHTAGLPLVFGTDLMVDIPGVTRGRLALQAIECWTEAGIPPAGILRALTSDAAKLLGIEKERGALQVGLAADLIAVDGDPGTDIAALQRTAIVVKDGRVVFRSATK